MSRVKTWLPGLALITPSIILVAVVAAITTKTTKS